MLNLINVLTAYTYIYATAYAVANYDAIKYIN